MELTDKECGIMQCIFCGMTNKQIAKHYNISMQTVKNRVSILMGKIGSKNRWFLASWWWVYAIDGKNEPTYIPDRRAKSNQVGPQKHRARKLRAPGNGVSLKEWEEIVDKYGGKCLKCGATTNLSMDHVIPLSKGGAHSPENIQPLCRKCNSRKNVGTTDYR